jgi:hypothetical protein
LVNATPTDITSVIDKLGSDAVSRPHTIRNIRYARQRIEGLSGLLDKLEQAVEVAP